jgi:hypothetical protein
MVSSSDSITYELPISIGVFLLPLVLLGGSVFLTCVFFVLGSNLAFFVSGLVLGVSSSRGLFGGIVLIWLSLTYVSLFAVNPEASSSKLTRPLFVLH